MVFVLLAQKKTRDLAAIALAAAILTKGFALVLVPMFCRTYGWRFTLIMGVALLYLGIPMYVYLPEFLHGMKQYLDYVHANSGLFHAVNLILALFTKRYSYAITEKLSDAAILAAAAWAAWRPAASPSDLLRRAFAVLSITLLVVPTLFPWYLMWLVPFAALVSRRPSWAFILLTGLVVLLYTYYISIMAYWWTPLVEYIPFYALLALEYSARRRSRQPQGTQTSAMRFWNALRPEEPPSGVSPEHTVA